MKSRGFYFIGVCLFFLVLMTPSFAAAQLTDADKDAIKDYGQVFRQVLQAYAVYSLVKPKNLALCAEEMLHMKANENSCRDSHSAWHSKEEWKEMNAELEGAFSGVGMQIGMRDGKVVVISPIEGMPAFLKGVKPGDEIQKIDGIAPKDAEDAVKRIRGIVGTLVKILFYRDGKPIEIEIKRANIKISPVESRTVKPGIGYLRMTIFSESLSSNVEAALDKFRKDGVKNVVLDLRGNPGGLLASAIEVLYKIARPTDTIVSTRWRTHKEVDDASNVKEKYGITGDPGKFRGMRFAALINKGSASASEIVAGTLKDWGFPVVGTTSFGKGVGQTIIPFADGSRLRLTTFEFLVGNSHTPINGIGVSPTYEVGDPKPTATADILREDRPLNKAVEVLSR